MAETENANEWEEFRTQLAALEKSVADLAKSVTRKHGEITDNLSRVAGMLDEVVPLVRRAAPLLDSPMAKLAQSPAAGVLGMFGGRRG
jgi:hypothetical protein